MEPRENSIDRARSYLESKGKIPSGALPSMIAESWHLSLENGLDPFHGVGDYVLSAAEFRCCNELKFALLHNKL